MAENHEGKDYLHPAYYNTGKIEVWDAIIDWDMGMGFLLGNVIKYCVRAGKKESRLKDLIKARNYINKAIEIELKNNPESEDQNDEKY